MEANEERKIQGAKIVLGIIALVGMIDIIRLLSLIELELRTLIGR